MRTYILVAVLLVALAAAAPLVDWVALPRSDTYTVLLDPPRSPWSAPDPSRPAWAFRDRINWEATLHRHAMSLATLAMADTIPPWRGTTAQVIVAYPGGRPVCGLAPGIGGANSCGDVGDVCTDSSILGGFSDSGVTKPYLIDVMPGSYTTECIRLVDKRFVSIRGSGPHATIIHPTWNGLGSIGNGGALTIDATASPTMTTGSAYIEISGLTVWSDDWGQGATNPFAGMSIGNFDSDEEFDQVYIHDNVIVGHGSGLKIAAGEDDATSPVVGAVTVVNNDIVGGSVGLFGIGNADAFISGNRIKAWTNFSESSDSTRLAARNFSTFNSSTTTSITVPTTGETVNGGIVEDFYALRRGKFTDSGGGTCNVATPTDTVDREVWIISYVVGGSDRTFHFVEGDNTALPVAPGAGCTFTVSPVAERSNRGAMPVTSVTGMLDWSVIRAGAAASHTDPTGTVSDTTAVKWDFGGSTVGPPDRDRWHLSGNTLETHFNDGLPGFPADVTCGANAKIGLMVFDFDQHESILVDSLNHGVLYLNADLPDGMACLHPVGLVSLTGLTTEIERDFVVGGQYYLKNPGEVGADGDSDVKTHGAVSMASGAGAGGALTLDRAYFDLDNTVAGYDPNNEVYLFQANTTTLAVRDLTASEPITTAGTILGWTERCFRETFPTVTYVAGSDNRPIPISDANGGLVVQYVGCRCVGTCGAAPETLDFEDDAGNQFASGVVCVDNSADMTWTDVRADAARDHIIPASKSPRFDVATPSTVATDNVEVCVRYTTTRFNP